jgi:hypothetical protein
VAVGLPDDVHRWYALARGIDLPGCGAYGRDMLPAVEDRSVHWVMFLYPRAMPEALGALRARGFEERTRLPGWIDWGGGEIVLLERR